MKLLVRKPAERMSIAEVLDHPWIVGEDASIKDLRRKSFDEGDEVMQFVAYSNTSLQAVEKNSPKIVARKNTSLEDLTAARNANNLQAKMPTGMKAWQNLRKDQPGANTGGFGFNKNPKVVETP